MFHTFLAKYRLTYHELISIKIDFAKQIDKFEKKVIGNCTKYYEKKYRGITWGLISAHKEAEFQFYFIEVQINPKVLLENTDYISISTCDDIEPMFQEFNKLSKEISITIPELQKYILYRIDYCINFNVSNINAPPKLIMQLLSRGDIPPKFFEWEEYIKKIEDKKVKKRALKKLKRKKPVDGNVYILNDSLHIQFYYKYMQLKKNNLHCLNIEEALHIIRFEVQCLDSKIYGFKSKFKNETTILNDNREMFFKLLSPEICKSILVKYYLKTIGIGDFVTLKAARHFVESSDFNKKKKYEMIEALQLINLKRSIHKAKLFLSSQKEKKKFNRTLENIKKLGISPITIPKAWNIPYIPNLINFLKNG